MLLALVVGVVACALAFVLVGVGTRQARPARPFAWALLAVVLLSTLGAALALGYYRMPIGWIIGLALGAVMAVSLFILTGARAGWQGRPVAAVAGAILAIVAPLAAVMVIAPPLPDWLLTARAAQIGQANGFTTLLVPGQQMVTDYNQPVTALAAPDAGVQIEYGRFVLQQRRAAGPLDADRLAQLVQPGSRPAGAEGQPIPNAVTRSETVVDGRPAVHASYTVVVPPAADDESPEATGRTEDVSLLLLERDGVLVLLKSAGYETTGQTGEAVVIEPLSQTELVALSESLEPAA